MSTVSKYSFIFFVFNTIFLSVPFLKNFGNGFFLTIMIFFSIVIFFTLPILIKLLRSKPFNFLILILIISFLYWIIFHSFFEIEPLKYISARTIQFMMICYALYFNFEYFNKKFPIHMAYFISFFVIIGLVINPVFYQERYLGIFWNENALSSFSFIAFSALFLKKNMKNDKLTYLLQFILLLVSLFTGSRSVILGIMLCFLFKFGFSIKNYIYSFFIVALYFIFKKFNFLTSFDRFFDSNSLLDDRILQLSFAFKTFMNKPIFGYGIDKYCFIDMDLVPNFNFETVISAHNGFLAVLVQFGFIFGGSILLIILRESFIIFNRFISIDFNSNNNKFYLFIIIFGLVMSCFETLFSGINEFHTILFFFSLALLNFKFYNILNQNQI